MDKKEIENRGGKPSQYLEEETHRKSTDIGGRPMFESQVHHLLLA